MRQDQTRDVVEELLPRRSARGTEEVRKVRAEGTGVGTRAVAEAASAVLDRRPTELRSLIAEVLDRALAPRDRVRCIVEAPRACLAWVDAARIERVVLAFVEIALRASPRGTAIFLELEQAHQVVVLSVSDASDGSSSALQTLGLPGQVEHGLAAARGIVEAHGGAVTCTTERGIGSRYTIVLPRNDDRLRILLVEEDERQLGVLAASVRRAGFDVATATCGSSALCTARAHAPDVAVVDVELPDVSVPELVQQLRDGRAWLPVVVASGYPPEHPRVVEALAASRGRFVPKPIDTARLLAEIDRITRTDRRDL